MVFGLDLVVELDGVGVVEGDAADMHAVYRMSVMSGMSSELDRPVCRYRAGVLTVTSVNVNGLRAAAKKGFVEWLAGTSADVRVPPGGARRAGAAARAGARRPRAGTSCTRPAAAKGRAGVSLYTRREPDRVRIGFGSAEFDGSGRYVEADLPGVTVACLYLPSGEVGTERQDEKVRFMGEFLALSEGPARARRRRRPRGRRLRRLEHRPPAGRPQELAGQPEELRLPPGGAGVADAGLRRGDGRLRRCRARRCIPDVEGPYTWWSYRGRAFDNDSGWRIDYHVATPGLAAKAVKGFVERAATHAERWSDHAPGDGGLRPLVMARPVCSWSGPLWSPSGPVWFSFRNRRSNASDSSASTTLRASGRSRWRSCVGRGGGPGRVKSSARASAWSRTLAAASRTVGEGDALAGPGPRRRPGGGG